MKVLKTMLLIISNILSVLFGIVLSAGIVYYVLPELSLVLAGWGIVISPTLIF